MNKLTCPRCDRADCDAVTGRAGPPEVIIVERRCDGEPVDWRHRAMEAESERDVGARLHARATDRLRDMESEVARLRKALESAAYALNRIASGDCSPSYAVNLARDARKALEEDHA